MWGLHAVRFGLDARCTYLNMTYLTFKRSEILATPITQLPWQGLARTNGHDAPYSPYEFTKINWTII